MKIIETENRKSKVTLHEPRNSNNIATDKIKIYSSNRTIEDEIRRDIEENEAREQDFRSNRISSKFIQFRKKISFSNY